MVDKCVFCGVVIPEGVQFCPNCKRKINALTLKLNKKQQAKIVREAKKH